MKNLNRLIPYVLVTTLLLISVACSSSVSIGSRSQNEAGGGENNVTIEVVAQEFSFTLSASQAKPGVVTFVVKNEGSMQHDFAISGNGVEQKTPMIDPGDSVVLEVELERGAYTYVCTVPGHAMLGMRGTFTVTS